MRLTKKKRAKATPQERAAKKERWTKRRRASPYRTKEELAASRHKRKAVPAKEYDLHAEAEAVRQRRAAAKALRDRLAAAETPEERELILMESAAARSKAKRQTGWLRRESRKSSPDFKEVDRIRHNAAMRKYRAKRRAADPAFADRCRESNRLCAARRRKAAGIGSAEEVDET